MYCVDAFDLRVREERGRRDNHSEDGDSKICNAESKTLYSEEGGGTCRVW